MLINFSDFVNQSIIYEKYMEFSKQNYLDRMIELGIEKKETNKNSDQNEGEAAEEEDAGSSQLKDA